MEGPLGRPHYLHFHFQIRLCDSLQCWWWDSHCWWYCCIFQEVCAKYDSYDLLCNLPFVCSGKQHSRSIIYGNLHKEIRTEIKYKPNSRNKGLNVILTIFYIIFIYSFSSRSQKFLHIFSIRLHGLVKSHMQFSNHLDHLLQMLWEAQ